MSAKIKPLNIYNVVSKLLLEGVDVNIVKSAFESGGLSKDESEYLISYVLQVESDRAVNMFHQYIADVKKHVNDVLNILAK